MPRKCCVFACQTNYGNKKQKSQEKIPVYRFPRDLEEMNRWIKAIPNANLRVTDNSVVCELHWPPDFPTVKVHGKLRPKDPPSVWPGVPKSQIPSPIPVPRSTKRKTFDVRSLEEDELEKFVCSDQVSFEGIAI